MTTALYHDERCFWHSAGEHVLILPLGPWLQPMAADRASLGWDAPRYWSGLTDASALPVNSGARVSAARRKVGLRVLAGRRLEEPRAVATAAARSRLSPPLIVPLSCAATLITASDPCV